MNIQKTVNKVIGIFGATVISFSVQAADEFAFGGLNHSCFSYPVVAMTPYDKSVSKYRATHSQVYHEKNVTGNILLYGPVQPWDFFGDGFLFKATFRDPDGSANEAQVIAQLRFIGDDGIKIIKTLRSNDFALATPDVQTMSSPIQLTHDNGYYIVRMYIQRTNTTIKPAAFGYNLCSAIF